MFAHVIGMELPGAVGQHPQKKIPGGSVRRHGNDYMRQFAGVVPRDFPTDEPEDKFAEQAEHFLLI